ncbi:MAG: transglutaminase-like domain-containing protein [Verrucomicrobiales bacterium]|nr:transglutaminase-like domain-containing protein [Verrucomicrobiales bacterium]
MVRGLLCFGGILAAALIAFSYVSKEAGESGLLSLFRPLPEVNETYQRGFRSDAISRINAARLPLNVDGARVDDEIQAFLARFVEQHPNPGEIELESVFNTLQLKFPGAQYLAANLVTSGERESLISKLAGWTAAASPDFDTVNTTVFTQGRRMGALAVMARRIPAFSLEAANEKGGRFFNECPHCGEVHALEVEKESRTLILSCPYCDLPFDVLAADTKGQIRRAPDFFEGFRLLEDPSAASQLSDEERIVALWQRITDQCEYQLDQDHSIDGEREVWKHSRETWDDKAGDCEDTSILLADALISAGFDTRVAIGWNGNIGQHAWVVVKAGGIQYVLESTLQDEISLASLVPAVDAAAFYQPEQLFDRENLYFTRADEAAFRRDYFSPVLWERLSVQRDGKSPQLSFR